MKRRYVYIWLKYLSTDWFTARQPALKAAPFVLTTISHGRMIITASNAVAEAKGVFTGMTIADARAFIPALQLADDKQRFTDKLLRKIAAWCIRFTPVAAIDQPDGIILDASGCAHLWGGEQMYVQKITDSLSAKGYYAKVAMADTVGAAWAMAHYGKLTLIPKGQSLQALLDLPPSALRLQDETTQRLLKLGLRHIKDFIAMPRSSLRRRFGVHILQRIDQALGKEDEIIEPVHPPNPFEERLVSLEPIVTAMGIEIALNRLLNALCNRLRQEEKGLRKAYLRCLRIDGKLQEVEIVTSSPSRNTAHIFKLFALKLSTIEPSLGIEVFILEAPLVEDHSAEQEKLWQTSSGVKDVHIAELIDRLTGRLGTGAVSRFLPDEHYWPERSVRLATSLQEQPATEWRTDKPRPVHLLDPPQPITVTAPVPDYPPMNFRYKGMLHSIVNADGPERIEQEWWLEEGQHRDYYMVEDEEGCRYWLFRSGHYEEDYKWFIHGFFA